VLWVQLEFLVLKVLQALKDHRVHKELPVLKAH
jgi:hypothetical protein